MTGAVEGVWIEESSLTYPKAGHVSIVFSNEYIVHIGGSQDGRTGKEEIEIWRRQENNTFTMRMSGPNGRLAYWQYWPNSFIV